MLVLAGRQVGRSPGRKVLERESMKGLGASFKGLGGRPHFIRTGSVAIGTDHASAARNATEQVTAVTCLPTEVRASLSVESPVQPNAAYSRIQTA